MATYSNLPGKLNVQFKRGDELGVTVDFSISLAGYGVIAQIYSLVTGDVLSAVSVSVTDAANGVAALSLSEAQTSSLPAGTLGLRVMLDAPGAVRRTVLEGFAEAV